MRWIGLKCSWLQLSARRAKPWVLPSNEINCSNGTLHCRHYPHGLESSARLVYDFIYDFIVFHRFSMLSNVQAIFFICSDSDGKVPWPLLVSEALHPDKSGTTQSGTSTSCRCSARQCETVRDNERDTVTPDFTWHSLRQSDIWRHLWGSKDLSLWEGEDGWDPHLSHWMWKYVSIILVSQHITTT